MYDFLRHIGRGGFGQVAAVRRQSDNVELAQKFLPDDEKTEANVRRFLREVRIQSKLNHPHIVQVIDVDPDAPSYVMELASSSLRDNLARAHADPRFREEVLTQLLAAVDYAHKNGVIHRDIKPENILLFDGPLGTTVKLSDFGLGRFLVRDSTTVTRTHAGAGTEGYAAPEQWHDLKNVDKTADIYAIGALLYEMLTGLPPLHIALDRITDGGLRYVVRRCTESDPTHRYQSVAELTAELNRVGRRSGLGPDQALKRAIGVFETDNAQGVKDVVAVYLANESDEEFYTNTLPSLPLPLLDALINAPEFEDILKAYDRFVDDELPYDYTDLVANLYERIFNQLAAPSVRELILGRLILMGPRHNRFHVGRVFARLVIKLSDRGADAALGRLMLENPRAAQWCRSYVDVGQLRRSSPLMADALREIGPG